MSMVEPARKVQAEALRVFDWRFAELRRAGYSLDQAWRLASAPDVDVRQAERLLGDGCTPEMAQRILL
jgi:hypothetical protein